MMLSVEQVNSPTKGNEAIIYKEYFLSQISSVQNRIEKKESWINNLMNSVFLVSILDSIIRAFLWIGLIP